VKKIILPLVFSSILFADFLNILNDTLKQYSPKESVQYEEKRDSKESLAIKEALEIGVKKAIDTLSKEGGFYNDPAVKIPLPDNLQLVANTLNKLHMQEYVKQFELSMNKAAQEAIPESGKILVEAIKDLELEDVKKIISGSNNEATEYFKNRVGKKLEKSIAPIIKKHIENENVTKYYEMLMDYYNTHMQNFSSDKYSLITQSLNIGNKNESNLTAYITKKALDALYKKIEEQERLIRTNPTARVTKLLQEVFGEK
jgi:hypothetical protein